MQQSASVNKFTIKKGRTTKPTLFKGVKGTSSEPNLTNFDTVTQKTRETLASIDETIENKNNRPRLDIEK